MSATETFSDIVKHQAQIKQFYILRFSGKLGEQWQAVEVIAASKTFDLFDQTKGMLIHRVNMISVVEYHAEQSAELGNERAQYSRSMHLQQGFIDRFLPGKNAEKDRIDFR